MTETNIGSTPSCSKSSDSLDLAYLEPSASYKCHICNVNVPTMCYQKHNESDPHETMKKISQKVLEGVTKQININTIHNKQNIDKDVYYCAPCSKIIKIENKQKHEGGDYHAKSVKVLNNTVEFYKILKARESYDESEVNKPICEVNEAALGEVDEAVLSEVGEAALAEVGVSETDRLKANYCNEINNLHLEISSSTLDSDEEYINFLDDMELEDREKLEVIIRILNALKRKSFEEYIKNMIKKFNLNVDLPVVKGKLITIVAPSGDTVQVSRQHFHSYMEIRDNVVYCQLCKKSMSKDTRLHDVSEDHVRNIFKPVDNMFGRALDTSRSHCVPCNAIVPTDCHTTHFDDYDNFNFNFKDTRTIKTGKTLCKECNVYVDTRLFPLHLHLNSRKLLSGNEQVSKLCDSCNLNVPKHTWKKHIRSKKHLAKIPKDSTILSNRSNDSTILSNRSNDSTILSNRSNDSTILSNRSNDSTVISDSNIVSTEIINQNYASTSTNNESPVVDIEANNSGYCELCNVKVPVGRMKIHVEGKPHKREVSKLCSENQSSIKPKENKLEIDPIPGSSNTGNTASTSGLYDNVASTSLFYTDHDKN